jgi:hypothetical protein
MVAQVKNQKTCANCPLFKPSNDLSKVGYCSKYQETTRAHDPSGNACPPSKKQKPTKAPRKPRSVNLVEISGWKEDTKTNTVYKLSSWKVIGSTGNTYSVIYDSRGSIICNCLGHTSHGHCYHAESVKKEWAEWQDWSNKKNSNDLTRNDGF